MPAKWTPDETCIRPPHAVPRGLLKLVILTLLETKEMTGTDIMRVLEKRSGGEWRPSPGSIYPLLSHLESGGIIEAISVSGRSKSYRLSERGRELLGQIREQKHHFDRKARIGPLFWFGLLEPSDSAIALVTLLKTLVQKIKEITAQLNTRQKQRVMRELRSLKEMIEAITGSKGGV